jgi:arylsulfatase A-like enzyme
VKPGTSKALVCQVDFVASLAALAGAPAPGPTARDSRNHLPALLGDDPIGRASLIEHAGGLAVRRGKWKLIPGSNGPKMNGPTNTELGNDPAPQLYDLDADPSETRNVAESHPDVLDQLRQILDDARAGR